MVFLAGMVWLIYGRTTSSPFIFDDYFSILTNSSIVRLWPLIGDSEQPGPLNPPAQMPAAGRPLVNLSLALNYNFGQLDPTGYHIFNLIVHMLSALLLMAIVRRSLRLEYFGGRFDHVSGPLAFLVALLWAVHPLQTESVIYITQRTELMVGCFYLATLYGSLRYWAAPTPAGRTVWLTLATLTCLAGMASKEAMVTAPVVVLLFERTFLAGSFRQALRRSWSLYVGLCLGWALLLALNYGGPRSGSAGFHLPLPAYAWWLTQTKVLLMYLKLVVWPWPLSIHYEMPYLTSPAAAWPWLLPVALLTIATVILFWQRKAIGFVGTCVLVILSPTLVVPIITEVAAERRMYLPLAALSALVVVGCYWLSEQMRKRLVGATGRWPVGFVAAASILVVAFTLVSIHRLAAYHDGLTLWQDAVANEPDDPIIHNNLGLQLANAGRLPDAIKEYEISLKLKPDYASAYYNMGIALANDGRSQEAVASFEEALRLKPDPLIHNNLGLALYGAGRIQQAVEHYQKALRLKPDYPEAHNNLGVALVNDGQTQEGIKRFERALRLKPDYAEAHVNLGLALQSQGRTQEAIDHYQQALRLKPDYAEAHNNLAMILVRAGRMQEAIEHLEQALRLKPDYAQAHINLSVALAKTGRPQEAVDHAQQAVQLKPEYADAWANLARAYARTNRSAEAIAAAQKALELARSQEQKELAERIEGWLTNYRSQLVNDQAAPLEPGDAQPSP